MDNFVRYENLQFLISVAFYKIPALTQHYKES